MRNGLGRTVVWTVLEPSAVSYIGKFVHSNERAFVANANNAGSPPRERRLSPNPANFGGLVMV